MLVGETAPVFQGDQLREAQEVPTCCEDCGCQVQVGERDCVNCGSFVSFPNVRYAAQPCEVGTLEVRYSNASSDAVIRSCSEQFSLLREAVDRSNVVIARDLFTLDRLIGPSAEPILPFYRDIESGRRFHKDNEWDPYRCASESTVNPVYFKEIVFGAVSLDGTGLWTYGDYALVLKEIAIRKRTSFFEENPFIFLRKKEVIAGTRAPPGYRSTWATRGRLAGAKLGSELNASTEDSDLQNLVMKQGTHTGDCDFIEAHIYGPIHKTAIEKVIARPPSNKCDRIIWESLKRRARNDGILVEEVK